MIRLFVGLTLPQSIRDYLTSLGTGVRQARWQRDDQLHITLKFVGEIAESTARDLDEVLSTIRMTPFKIMLDGLGLFGDLKKPRALWAGLSPKEEITRLHDKIETAAFRVGLPRADRKFTPHVTLARFSAQAAGKAGGLGDFLRDRSDIRTPAFHVTSFALFSSHLSPQGSSYHIEASYPLQAARSDLDCPASNL